jgi:hypothetical protein
MRTGAPSEENAPLRGGFGRIARILLGYIAGCLAAGLAIAVPLGAFAQGVGLSVTLAVGGYAAGFALLPLGIGIIAGEMQRWRSPLIWMALGAGVALFALFELGHLTPGISEHRFYLYVVAGLVWGVVYWAIAGRDAGAPADPHKTAAG